MSAVITNPDDIQPYAVNVAVATKMLGLANEWATRRLIKAGKIRVRSTGRQYIIPIKAIEEFLAGDDGPMRHPESA
ncbi:hypothetical protein [Saccharopolyspora sp. NPDC002376]